MDFKAHYLSLDAAARQSLAKQLGTSVPYLSQLAHGHRIASRRMALKIEDATGGRVSAANMLFPGSAQCASPATQLPGQ